MNLTVHTDVACNRVLYDSFIEAALATIDLQVFKSEILCGGSALGDGYVVENVTMAGAVFDGYVVDPRRKSVVAPIAEKIQIYKAYRAVAGDIFEAYEFIVLRGVVAELEPKQIYGFVYVTVADDDVFVVDGLGSAGQSSVAEAVVAILNQNTLIFAVFGKLVGIYALATLEHHRVVVDVEVAVLDKYVVTNVYINGVRAWRSDGGVRSEDLTIQIPYVVALVDVS